MEWNPGGRHRFLRQLDDARRRVQLVYAVVLIGTTVLLLSFLGYAFWKWRGHPLSPLGLFLGGVFLAWVLGQLRAIYLDMPPPPGKLMPGDFGPTEPSEGLKVESHSQPGRHEFKLSFGSPPAGPGQAHSASFTIPLGGGSTAATELPDEAALNSAEALMNEGFDLERACRYVNPQYTTWNPLQRRAYALSLETRLAARKKPHS
ncbi:MAG: hypothetical protein L0099_12705 [Acidobacteria bacterium]|nr:hypothetical protein [Acidobacteriota bacterium]